MSWTGGTCFQPLASLLSPPLPASNSFPQVEQDVVCQTPSLATHYEAVQALVGNLAVDEADRLRLTLLFGLRYERDGQVQLAALLRTLTEQVRCAVGCAVQCCAVECGTFRQIVLPLGRVCLEGAPHYRPAAPPGCLGMRQQPALMGSLQCKCRRRLPTDAPSLCTHAAPLRAWMPTAWPCCATCSRRAGRRRAWATSSPIAP